MPVLDGCLTWDIWDFLLEAIPFSTEFYWWNNKIVSTIELKLLIAWGSVILYSLGSIEFILETIHNFIMEESFRIVQKANATWTTSYMINLIKRSIKTNASY